MKHCYLAGPMTGIPYFNFPLFDSAAKRMRNLGWDIMSPAEMDSEELRAAALASPDGAPSALPTSTKWGDVLARDVQVIANDCDKILLLPDWSTSKGATLEAVVGLLVGCEFFLYIADNAVRVNDDGIRELLVLGASHRIDSLGGVQSYGN